MLRKLFVIAIAASIGLAPLSASAQWRRSWPGLFGGPSSSNAALTIAGCVVGIMIAAVDKGNKYKKELTTEEAITCGLLYWVNETNRDLR